MKHVWNLPFAIFSRFVVLKELELRHFRNLGVQELHFPPEGVAVIGENAQGKTNLLEAIYYLESFRSFRGAGDGELGAFPQDVFHVKGWVDGDRPVTVSAGFDRKRRRKKVSVDGTEALRVSAALGRLGAVVFSPSDVELVAAGPHVRRRFLDIVLSLDGNGYVEALSRYRKALAQRNAALRANAPTPAVQAWDAGLVVHGARVTHLRHSWITNWSGAFETYCTAISGCDSVRLAYRSDLGRGDRGREPGGEVFGADEEEVGERFAARLHETRETDLRRGVTTVGPHRDELLFTMASHGRPLAVRRYGSGGQRRTAALALRLTEAATIRCRQRTDPILLLDDAFAELDEGRSNRVMSLLREEGTGQVILTAPKDSDARLRGPYLERWRIREGVIEA